MNEIAAKLKRLRAARRVSQLDVARALTISKSLVASFEQGRLIPQADTAEALDAYFGSGDTVRTLSAQAHEEREREKQQQPAWFAPWPDVEREAVALRCFEACTVPGLAQSKEYARSILSCGLLSPEQVEAYSARRLARQAAVFDRDDPPVCQFLIDEAALRRGAPDLMRDQLSHLVELGRRPYALIQVVPESAGLYLGQGGGFAIADLPGGHRAAFIDGQLDGDVITSSNHVGTLEWTWQAISGVALPCDQSRDLILKMVERCEQRRQSALAEEHPQRP